MTKPDLVEPLTDEDGEVRELTDADFAAAMHFHDLPQSMQEKLRQLPWAKRDEPKEEISFPISSDVLARYKATGEGWQERMGQALREWIERVR
jgi:uncharacterized protein (DUF4415 family)